MPEHELPEQVWTLVQNRLGYDHEEMALFRADPRNARVLETGVEMRSKTIVFEVVESEGCNSQHGVGTRFYFTGDGNLITKMAPSRVCVFAVPPMSTAIFAFHELMYAGVDPNEACFKRGGCFDVGVRCGGWGHIVVEGRVLDRAEADQLFAAQG